MSAIADIPSISATSELIHWSLGQMLAYQDDERVAMEMLCWIEREHGVRLTADALELRHEEREEVLVEGRMELVDGRRTWVPPITRTWYVYRSCRTIRVPRLDVPVAAFR